MTDGSTIVALSSGGLPAGIAVIRLSGPQVRQVLETLVGGVPEARVMTLRALKNGRGEVLDRALVVFFPTPHSFTGEDCAELHVHGSRAVVAALLDGLCGMEGVALAEAGAFTRRAFEAGKLDLTSVEGVGDLIAAETETQRRQALARASGALRAWIAAWRAQLIGLRADIEAQLDFADEGDVPEALSAEFTNQLNWLRQDLQRALAGFNSGRIARDGFRVVLAGAPNVGKSSLLNALVKSDVAIVTAEAGTTRDVREVPLDLNGQMVLLYDVAGLRETQSAAEAEGVRRAHGTLAEADLVLWLTAPDIADIPMPDLGGKPVVTVATKADLGATRPQVDFIISVKELSGIEALLAELGERAGAAIGHEAALVSHKRDAEALLNSLDILATISIDKAPLELVAESLRAASDSLGRLTGEIDAEAVLDRLFAGFCIGK